MPARTLQDCINQCKQPETWARDKHRSETQQGRYESLAFPAYHGAPLRTNSKHLAILIAFIRSFSYVETRVIDLHTNTHIYIN